jgi:3',5'-cyclic AMP phosphodiesterase CpdA
VRLGLISDVHWMTRPPASTGGWHGPGEYAGALDRVRTALEHFADRHADLIVLAGDLAHHGDPDSLLAVLAACRQAPAPVLVATGNHDVSQTRDRLSQALADVADPNLSLVTASGAIYDGTRVAGVHVGEIEGLFWPRLSCLPDTNGWGAEPVVLVSHYPVISLNSIVSAAGLPYPGDLLDRRELCASLLGPGTPTIVIGGHVHARATAVQGTLLQLTVGAMIEPPYECALIEIDDAASGGLIVRRENIRLRGASDQLDPVFSPVGEAWRYAARRWTQAPGSRMAQARNSTRWS